MTDYVEMLEDNLPLIGTSPFKIITAIIILFVGLIVIRLVVKWLKKFMIKGDFGEILAEFLSRLVRIMLLVFLIGTVLGVIGLSIGPALISFSVVLGFVLGFAMGDTLANIAAGFMIAITKPFKKGDYVKVNGEEGVLQSVGISMLEMNTVDNKRVIIPNKLVWGSNIVNYTRNPIRRVDMEVGVAYDADLNQTLDVIHSVIKADSKILDDPGVQIEVKEMADSAVVFVVRPWCRTEHYWDVFFAFQKACKEALDQAGIGIPFPQMDVHLDKGE
jgi:small-conductance mechanosensitive channel